MQRKISGIALALFILGTLFLVSSVQFVRAQGVIYIRSDGSIDPPGASVSTADKVTYVLTGNVTGSIVVERNGIVLDGAGYLMEGDGLEDGITLLGRSSVTVKDMVLDGYRNGIYLNYSVSNTLRANNVTYSESGIGLDYFSNNNVLFANRVINNSKGIWLDYSVLNSLSGNEIDSNMDGIEIWFSSGNTLSGNNVTASRDEGLRMWESNGNKISHNNMLNNSLQVYTLGSNNVWDNGYPSGGNYWSDDEGVDLYKGPAQIEPGSDGICDTPYVIDANNTDLYPLMKPSSFTASLPGDLNGDGKVSLADLVILALAYSSKPGDKNWNTIADINGDGKVSLADLVILAQNYGKTS